MAAAAGPDPVCARSWSEERTREIQRLQQVLEDAGIKLDSVASDVMGKSARAMLDALIAGERDPAVLADFAQTRMRLKIPELGWRWRAGSASTTRCCCACTSTTSTTSPPRSTRLDAQVEAEVAPFAKAVELLGTIPGLGPRTA